MRAGDHLCAWVEEQVGGRRQNAYREHADCYRCGDRWGRR